jgi:hypothetical protein
MNYKAKSILYFASLVIAMVAYYTTGNVNTVQNTDLANNTITHVSTQEALN